MKANFMSAASAALLAAMLAGCNMTGALEAPPAMPTGQAPRDTTVTTSDAGVGVTPSPDATKLTSLVATRDKSGANGMTRPDPFALTAEERAFEGQQSMERIFSTIGGFSVEVTEKPEVIEEAVPPEEQPYRRLSGIVVGDSVLAILEEGGQSTIITPGMQIPNSPWRVVSIDQDKAVLRRSGNVKPTQIIVRLETPRFGTQPAGGAPGGGPGGFPGGGPGGGPGGYPGGGPGGYPGRGGPGGRDSGD